MAGASSRSVADACGRGRGRAGAAADAQPAAQVPDFSFKYTGGEFLNDSVPGSCDYAEFMYRITQKVQRAVSVKYLNPGDELDPENLTSVLGDDDLKVGARARSGGDGGDPQLCPVLTRALPAAAPAAPQEMFDEYFRGLQRPNTPQKTFRIRLFLFDAEFDFSPEAMGFTDEEVQACEQAIQRCAPCVVAGQALIGQCPSPRAACTPPADALASPPPPAHAAARSSTCPTRGT
jgi:hypothetical protein